MRISLAKKVLSPEFIANLERIIDPHNRKAYDRTGKIKRDCSTDTRKDRKGLLERTFAELVQQGYGLRNPEGLREKHVRALAAYWELKGYRSQTITKRFTTLRVFAGWIGKPGLVKGLEEYFPNREGVKRTSIATRDLSWDSEEAKAKGVVANDMFQRAREMDEHFGCMLEISDAFALRVKELLNWYPLRTAFKGAIELNEGTKGGRPRLVPIETEGQLKAVEWAQRLAGKNPSGRLRWRGKTWVQAKNHFYYLMRKLGATKKQLGITAHGLRHGNLQRQQSKLTGQATPIKGGDPKKNDWSTFRMAAVITAQVAGHNRPMGNYYGSFGHDLRSTIPHFTSGDRVHWVPLNKPILAKDVVLTKETPHE